MIKAVYFDLFFTLIIPSYEKINNEYDILHLSMTEWENYAENDMLYQERALGQVKSEMEIIDRIVSVIPFQVNDIQKKQILSAREKRMKNALHNVPEDMIDVLKILKTRKIKIGLISNADIIDCKYWGESKLASFFDDVIFSCNVGFLKPDRQIYELAMQNLKVLPDESLFVGDGGSNELFGAKSAGMKTIFTEALENKNGEKRNNIMKYADYHINNFAEILKYV